MVCFPLFFCTRVRHAAPDDEEVSGIQNVKIYKYKELQGATDDFSPENKIGQGGFGSVYKFQRSRFQLMNMESMDVETCIKCGEGGNVLVCRSSHCAMIIHESCCARSSLQVHDRENFFCPYCLYKQSVAECSQAKKKALLAERNLALFLGPNRSLNQEHEPNITKDKRTRLHNDEEHGNQERGTKNKEIVQFVHTKTDLDNGEYNLGRMKKMRTGERFLRKCEGGSNIAMPNGLTPEKNYVRSRWQGKVLSPVPLNYCKENSRVVVMLDDQLDNCNVDKGVELVTSVINLGEKSISSTSGGDSIEMNEDSEYRDSGCDEPNADDAGWIAKPSQKIPDGVRFRRQKRIRWSAEEEEMLKKGVLFFSSSVNKNLPWRKILVYGNAVFHEWRTPLDLQSKWNLMTRKEHPKSNEA